MVDDQMAPGLARLMELGEPKYSREFQWPDYRELGLCLEDIPALISLATNRLLLGAVDESDPRCWAPVHAWRALGQMHAQEAIQPLICLFHEVRDNDWVIEEMPDVFALIGPAAFDDLAKYLRNTAYPTYSRLVAATCLMQIALAAPEMREESVSVLAERLEDYRCNSAGMNGVLIANLVELQAVEMADLIHKVFSEGKVDRFIAGDWRDVRVRLGLRGRVVPRGDPSSLTSTLKKSPPDPERKASMEPRTQPRAASEPHTQPRSTSPTH